MTVNSCRRCGTCCEKGGPGLHVADMGLLEHIPMKDVVCLRRGELEQIPLADMGLVAEAVAVALTVGAS